MFKRYFFLKVGVLLMLVTLMIGAGPTVTYAQQGPAKAVANAAAASQAWHPAPAKAGLGSLVWINYNGGGDELTVDLAGKLYKVSPDANGIPGRLQIEVAPGSYNYTASTPFGAISRTVELSTGQVMGLSFFGKLDVPSHGRVSHSDKRSSGPGRARNRDHHNSDAHISKFTELLMSQEDLTAQAR